MVKFIMIGYGDVVGYECISVLVWKVVYVYDV